jgi:hypothetical protein
MHHIHKLGRDLADARVVAQNYRDRIQELREHLMLPKFTSASTDGRRTDWIACADVRAWLDYISNGGEA